MYDACTISGSIMQPAATKKTEARTRNLRLSDDGHCRSVFAIEKKKIHSRINASSWDDMENRSRPRLITTSKGRLNQIHGAVSKVRDALPEQHGLARLRLGRKRFFLRQQKKQHRFFP